MQRTIVTTANAPAAIGPYSQAVWAGDYLFCSGQIPLDPATGNLIPGGIVEQTRQVLTNLQAVLRSQNLDLDRVVKTTVFLADLAHFPAMNEVYAKYFASAPPSRSTIQVARLPKDALVEIEAVACR
jgi:2-iminobutanoate/2-iminopropanoate deaminase